MSTVYTFTSFGLRGMTVPHQKRGLILQKDEKKRPGVGLQHFNKNTKNKKSTKGKDALCRNTTMTLKLVKQPSHSKDNQTDKRLQPLAMKQCRKIGTTVDCDFVSLSHDAVISKKYDNKLKNVKVKARKSSRFIVKSSEMVGFFHLTEDPVLQEFLKADTCKVIADKYLLSMVFAYFKRAELSLQEYSLLNFFVALFLANDMEEDEEELKYEIFPWALGQTWKKTYKDFMRLRDLLFRRMEYKAIISRRCCEEIIAIEPEHKLWQRCRPTHHSGAIRTYERDSSFGTIYGPFKSPPICLECDPSSDDNNMSDSSHSVNVSVSPTWNIFPELEPLQVEANKENLGCSQGMCSTLTDNIWNIVEE